MTTINASSPAASRCAATIAEAGQCQLNGPHPGKPHAVRFPASVLCWNHLETHRWPDNALPQWIVRLPWAAESAAA
jgi:hypothetical protein